MGERRNLRPYLLMAVVFISYCPCPVLATTYYVNPGQSIQAAIDGASYGDTIEVAAGTYVENITLKNGVALIGEAINVMLPDDTIIDGNAAGSVVTSINCDPNTILEGFKITNGIAGDGGGMNNSNSNPTITNCSFSDNSADGGGGMYNNYSSPTMTYCSFISNLTEFGAGGGMYNTNNSNPTLIYCGFVGNSAFVYGGGMYNSHSSPTLINCNVSGNSAEGFGLPLENIGYGGGMHNSHSSPKVTNCRFLGNTAFHGGGGMCNWDSSTPTVTNCIITGNVVEYYFGYGEGGGIHNKGSSFPALTNCTIVGNSAYLGGGMASFDYSSAMVTNCIIWGNMENGPFLQILGGATITYSDIEWGYPGLGNIDADPRFNNSTMLGLHLLTGSPCIDAGNNTAVPAGITTDLDGNPRFDNDPLTADTGSGTPPIVDMGAFESPLIIYVDESAAGANNGRSWQDAYNYLQDALNDPCLLNYKQLRVAEGTYKPDQGQTGNVTPEDRNETFELINGVAIYGGFPSGGGTWQDRDPILYETILSGDLREDDRRDYTRNEENSYHVVTTNECEPNTILDGFTIYGGNADGEDIYVFGGGMFNELSSPTVVRCKFIGNSAEQAGGGMFNNGGTPTVINCMFLGNSTDWQGGGIYNKYSESTVVNCVLSGNSASSQGGGMCNTGVHSTVVNCTFSNNSAPFPNGRGMYNYYSSPTVTNCIMWSDVSKGVEIYNENTCVPLISYCDIEDSGGSGAGWDTYLGTDGGGNIDDDPLFKDADGPDNHVGTADDELQPAKESPCIDAGINAALPADTADLDSDGDKAESMPLDLAGNARFTDDPLTDDTGNGPLPIVEIGAYERYEFCGDAGHPFPVGDVNRDCKVNSLDIAMIAAHWLEDAGPE